MDKDYLNRVFIYKDGVLYNKERRANRAPAGAVSGYFHKESGYHKVKAGDKTCKRSRVTWIMHFGVIPPGFEVDHINRIRNDDSLNNLRLVTRSENNYNRNCKGYTKTPNGKYCVRIMSCGVDNYIGLFDTPQEARLAYLEAKLDVHIIRGIQ